MGRPRSFCTSLSCQMQEILYQGVQWNNKLSWSYFCNSCLEKSFLLGCTDRQSVIVKMFAWWFSYWYQAVVWITYLWISTCAKTTLNVILHLLQPYSPCTSTQMQHCSEFYCSKAIIKKPNQVNSSMHIMRTRGYEFQNFLMFF